MVSIIIFLFIAIMVVLIRRLKGEQDDHEYWDDDYDEYEEEDIISDESVTEEVETAPVEVINGTASVETKTETSESKEDLRARLAAEAKRTGVMQAAPGTEQGKTGWYIDSDGQLTSWLVSESGEWTRMS